MYVRDSSEKIIGSLSIFFLLIITFIVLNQYVNFVVVTSDSMSPTFYKGDLVLVQSFNRTPAIGNIIQFQTPSRKLPVMHRVQEILPYGYKTKGDFSLTSDYWIVTDSQIQAKAIYLFNRNVIIPHVGNFFICESTISKFGSEFAFISGLVNIFRILALIIFILAFLSLSETIVK